MRFLLTIFIILCIPVVAWAGMTDDAIDGFAAAIKAGKWGVAVGFMLLALTQLVKYLATKLEKEIPTNWQPWVAAILGVIGSVGLALSIGIVWWEALVSGIFFGAAAGGLWSLVVKHFAKGKR